MKRNCVKLKYVSNKIGSLYTYVFETIAIIPILFSLFKVKRTGNANKIVECLTNYFNYHVTDSSQV